MPDTRTAATAIGERAAQLAEECDRLCWSSIEGAVILDTLDTLALDAGDGYARGDHLWRARGLLVEATRELHAAAAA